MGFVVETPPGDVAFSIALGVLLLTVILEPIVRRCVHRIRAAQAWKSIKNKEAVDITKYNIFSEALGDRGKWDTARVVTIMLSAFHVSTWGLELSLDLAIRTDGPVDLMNRPPPVVSSGNPDDLGSSFDWIVQENLNAVDEKGTLNNFKNGTLEGYATSVYRIGDGLVMGSRVFASWSTAPDNSPSELFYDDGDVVDGVVCSAGATSHAVILSGGQNGQQVEEWGTAMACDAGPALLNMSSKECPPAILLSGGGNNNLHVIVEEASSYPSFLYSVWRPVFFTGDGSNASEPAEMRHVFYVSSTTRLAEAIVSGVVNGIMSGGGCVDLLLQFSVANTTYELNGLSRVAPFGEYPSFSSVESIDQVEAIVRGVKVNEIGVICGLILMVVTGASFVGCLGAMRSRAEMDVFDRDAVIRAVALPNGGQEADITSPALKIYVRQADDARFGMVVSDDTARRRWINRCAKAVASAFGGSSPTEEAGDDDDGDGDEPPPSRGISRSWSLPRASFSRTFGDRERLGLDLSSPQEAPVRSPPVPSPTFVELVASPVPSLVRWGSQSVLRRLPAFFSSSMTAPRLEDSSTERAHSSMTDPGHFSPGASSRSMNARALHGKDIPPADTASPTAGDVGAPEPVAAHACQFPTSSSSSAKKGAIDVRNAAPLEDDEIAKENVSGGGAAEVVAVIDDGAGEVNAVDGESTGGANTEAKGGAPQPRKALSGIPTAGNTGEAAGARCGVDRSSQAIGNTGTEEADDGLASQTPTASSGKSEGKRASPSGGASCVNASTPAAPIAGALAAEVSAVPGDDAENTKTESE